jgi:hypothetical protein
MSVKRYRKKPVEVTAVQWNGDNYQEIIDFFGSSNSWRVSKNYSPKSLSIQTLEGTMNASLGDYIICGVQGEFYPCKPDIFDKTYYALVEDREDLTVGEVVQNLKNISV